MLGPKLKAQPTNCRQSGRPKRSALPIAPSNWCRSITAIDSVGIALSVTSGAAVGRRGAAEVHGLGIDPPPLVAVCSGDKLAAIASTKVRQV